MPQCALQTVDLTYYVFSGEIHDGEDAIVIDQGGVILQPLKMNIDRPDLASPGFMRAITATFAIAAIAQSKPVTVIVANLSALGARERFDGVDFSQIR